VNTNGHSVTSKHYFNKEGENYFNWQNRYQERSGIINARKFQDKINSDSTILDFGCGSGYLLNALTARKKIGIEVNPVAVKFAKSMKLEVYGDLRNIPTKSIDACVSNHALEHVYYPLEALSEIYRVLRKGGKLLLCVPIDEYRDQKKFLKDEINNHLHTWTPQLIGNLCLEAGFKFENIKIKVLKHAWVPGTKYIWRYTTLFNAICWIYSVLSKKGKQIFIEAQKI
jgi:SAM-dependent methyltransferase